MRILLIDDDKHSIYFLKLLKKIQGYEIVHTDYTIKQYVDNSVEIVMIDHSSDKNNQLLNKILEINPSQKVIIISDSSECSPNIGCDNCLTLYNKRRLLKPLDFKEFTNLIENFDNLNCYYSNPQCMDNLQHIISGLVRRFNFYHYDQDKNLIYSNHRPEDFLVIQQELEIIKILNSYDIKYEIEGINIQLIF